jgi:hypothetical protein
MDYSILSESLKKISQRGGDVGFGEDFDSEPADAGGRPLRNAGVSAMAQGETMAGHTGRVVCLPVQFGPETCWHVRLSQPSVENLARPLGFLELAVLPDLTQVSSTQPARAARLALLSPP